jgi:hypothetical protein
MHFPANAGLLFSLTSWLMTGIWLRLG